MCSLEEEVIGWDKKGKGDNDLHTVGLEVRIKILMEMETRKDTNVGALSDCLFSALLAAFVVKVQCLHQFPFMFRTLLSLFSRSDEMESHARYKTVKSEFPVGGPGGQGEKQECRKGEGRKMRESSASCGRE